MPVDDIFWDVGIGADYHLVPGLVSPRLDQLLSIIFDGNLMRADAPPPGVVVTFVTTFVPGSADARGVAFNPVTGEVTVTSPLAAPSRLLDFIVVAVVIDGVHAPFNAHIRFNIHAGLTRMWLTPSPLTVRQGARNVRHTVLAEFADGTYGDVSNWSPWREPGPQDRTFVHPPGANPQPLVTWGSSAVGSLDVHRRTGNLTCKSAGAAAQIQVSTPLPSVATGQAVGAAPWSTPLTVAPAPGPGFLDPDKAPNVLILSDGFQVGEQGTFLNLAGRLVARLAVDARTSPFRELSGRINYFTAFVESRESGIAPLSPVERFLVPGNPDEAVEIDVGIPAAGAATTPPTIGTPPTPATNTQFLLNELDTAFFAVLGERPQAQRFYEIRGAAPSPRRFDEDDFDDFLGALKDPAGKNIGRHWQRGGKDEVAVLMLCRTDHYGGGNNSRNPTGAVICLPLGVGQIFHIKPAAVGLGQEVIADPLPARINVELRTRAAHELAHSFTLGDEYGGGGDLPASFDEDIEATANVQARASVTGRGVLDAAGRFDADLIKWRWPRVVKADVLRAAPTPSGAGHRLQISSGHPFKGGEVVRLRTHPLPTSVASERLRVREPVGADFIDVDPVGAPLAGNFPAGSRVIAPKRAPDPAGGLGDDLELVHVDVRKWIGSSSLGVAGQQNPLNARPGPPGDRSCPGPEPTRDPTTGVLLPSTPARNYPQGAAPIPPAESAWITGLFEMGRGFDCGVYHPTGACIMGVHAFNGGASSFQFCWVCRYAMVDFVDPSLHGVIDRAYDYQVSAVSDQRGSLRVVADHLAQAVAPARPRAAGRRGVRDTDGTGRMERARSCRRATPRVADAAADVVAGRGRAGGRRPARRRSSPSSTRWVPSTAPSTTSTRRRPGPIRTISCR